MKEGGEPGKHTCVYRFVAPNIGGGCATEGRIMLLQERMTSRERKVSAVWVNGDGEMLQASGVPYMGVP